MDILIKYRNDRKKEGASKGELAGLDGRINSAFSTGLGTMDLEILTYRQQIAETGNAEFLERIDKHIFHLLGSKPANIVDVKVATVSRTTDLTVAVDLSNETVRDLSSKVHTVLGCAKKGKIIFRGNTYEDSNKPLSETPLRAGDAVVLIGGNSATDVAESQIYARLCDANLRDAKKLFDNFPADKLHELFVIMTKMKAQAQTEDCSKAAEALWAAALRAPREPLLACELLPLKNRLLSKTPLVAECQAALSSEWASALRCEALTKSEWKVKCEATEPAAQVVPVGTANTVPVPSDEDLYG